MSLFYFELKKNYLKKSIFICVVIFIILNIFKINEQYRIYGRFSGEGMISIENAYEDLYNNKLKGRITQDNIEFVMDNYTTLMGEVKDFNYSTEYDENRYTGYTYGDYGLFTFYIIPELEYVFNYMNFSNDIVLKAIDNIDFFQNVNNEYQVKNNMMIKQRYSNRNIDLYYKTEGFEKFYSYDFSSLLVILVLILGISPVFSSEKEIEMDILLNTTKLGRNKVNIAKILSAYSFIFFVSILFLVTDLIVHNNLYGLEGFTNPIYSIKGFMISPLNVTIIEYLILSYIVKFLGFITLGTMMLIISSFFKNSVVPIILNIGISFFFIYINEFLGYQVFNPLNLITNHTMFIEYDTINILQTPILDYYIKIGLCIILLVLMTIILYSKTRFKTESASNNGYFKIRII